MNNETTPSKSMQTAPPPCFQPLSEALAHHFSVTLEFRWFSFSRKEQRYLASSMQPHWYYSVSFTRPLPSPHSFYLFSCYDACRKCHCWWPSEFFTPWAFFSPCVLAMLFPKTGMLLLCMHLKYGCNGGNIVTERHHAQLQENARLLICISKAMFWYIVFTP